MSDEDETDEFTWGDECDPDDAAEMPSPEDGLGDETEVTDEDESEDE